LSSTSLHKIRYGIGRKEAPLVVVGSHKVGDDQQREQTILFNDAEYTSYTKLLKSFFNKLSRWQEIFDDNSKSYTHQPFLFIGALERYRNFDVVQTPTGDLAFGSIDPDQVYGKETPTEVIHMSRNIMGDDPKHNEYYRIFSSRPGLVGKHLFVDPDGKPLQEIKITVANNDLYRELTIDAEYPPEVITKPTRHIAKTYSLRENSLFIERYLFHQMMTDAYAVHLISTIDALIPSSTTPTPQPDRKASQGTPIPNALPPARRRKPGR
jgi:hypothetical protein